MNRITRMLTMTGLGLVAGATMAAGPALAATGTGQAAGQSSAAASQAQGSDREWVAGVFRSYRACVIAGRIGERFDRWDDFDCERRGWGRYVLEVSRDWDGPWIGRPWGNHHGHGGRPWGGRPWGGHHGGGHHGGGHHGGGHHGGHHGSR